MGRPARVSVLDLPRCHGRAHRARHWFGRWAVCDQAFDEPENWPARARLWHANPFAKIRHAHHGRRFDSDCDRHFDFALV